MITDTAGKTVMANRIENPDQFSERLISAFLHLSPDRKEEIRTEMEKLGIGGGLKAGIARLVGIRTQSLLSDMFAGRAKGHRYRKQLADLLGVSDAWLAGNDNEPPDWCLQPGEAYQRLCRRVRRAWAERSGRAVRDTVDTPEDDSSRNRLWSVWLDDQERRRRSEDADRALIAEGLAIDADSDDADWLAASRYERVSFETFVRFSEWLGVPRLSHSDVPREGHRAVQIALAHQEWLAKAIQARIDRCYLPPHLFTLARRALVREREEYKDSGRNTQEVDDCLELLWRQQQRRDKRDSSGCQAVPNEFTADTGRAAWTDLRLLQNRRRLDRGIAAAKPRRLDR